MRQYSTVLSVNREDRLITEGQQFENMGITSGTVPPKCRWSLLNGACTSEYVTTIKIYIRKNIAVLVWWMLVRSKLSIKKNNVFISKGKIVSELKKTTSTDTCHISPVLFFWRSKANSIMSASSWVPLKRFQKSRKSAYWVCHITFGEQKEKG